MQKPCPNSRSEPSVTSSLAHIKGSSKDRCLIFLWSCVDIDHCPLPKQYGSDLKLLPKSTCSKLKGWKTPSLLNLVTILLKKDYFFFFQRKTHENCIPNPKQSVAQRQVKRAKYVLVLEWSGTMPVWENRGETILSRLHLSQLHVFAPWYSHLGIYPLLDKHPYEKGERLWNQFSVFMWSRKSDTDLKKVCWAGDVKGLL